LQTALGSQTVELKHSSISEGKIVAVIKQKTKSTTAKPIICGFFFVQSYNRILKQTVLLTLTNRDCLGHIVVSSVALANKTSWVVAAVPVISTDIVKTFINIWGAIDSTVISNVEQTYN